MATHERSGPRVEAEARTSSLSQKKTGSAQPWRVNAIFVVFVHVISLLAILFVRPAWQTILMFLVVEEFAKLGITMGYHRLWSHKSYEAAWPLRLFLVFLGTLGFQGSAKWWVHRHRLHHRFTDTENDPYNALRGFYFCHIGWIFQKASYPKYNQIDVSDLDKDPLLRFQHKFYVPLALVCGIILPTLVAGLWGDMLGSFFYCGYVCRVVIWHCTFLINSLAHWTGEQHYTTEVSARGNLILALLTVGEGHHNYHHAFPHDYRNGVKFWDWDPTKWSIYLASKLGLASNLRTVDQDEIAKARVQTMEQKASDLRKTLTWGPSNDSLRSLSRLEVQRLVISGEQPKLLIIQDSIVDLSSFEKSHPGGEKILKLYYGKDATQAFTGGLNKHTQAARNLVAMLRIAVLTDSDQLKNGSGDDALGVLKEE